MLRGSLSFTPLATGVNWCKMPLISISHREQSKLVHMLKKGCNDHLPCIVFKPALKMLGLGGLAQACNGIKLLFTLHTAVSP